MKRVQIISAFLWVVCSYACTSESIRIPSEPSPLTCEILTRGLNNNTHLCAGSTILLNATGGLQISNETFTYNGTKWISTHPYNWTDLQEETSITALYPVYDDQQYRAENIYSEEGLEDILISQHTFQRGASIELQFKHLFSLLTIHLGETIQNEWQEIRLSVPVKVDNISPSTGTISTLSESHTTIQTNNGSGDYPFILPPSNDCTVTLTLVMKDGKIHTHPLNPHTFQSGYEYHCNVVKAEEHPGIDSAEDLIIFSQLINGTYTGDKTLSDFGEQTTDGMVFRLLADIKLTETDCQQLSPIGDHEDTPFSDIFDGGNHTISNLILSDKTTTDNSYTGLFGFIGNQGIVRNLHIKNAQTIDSPTCTYIGVIAAKNNGIINNCSVTDSYITSISKSISGLIASLSTGYIINCYTKNNTFTIKEGTYYTGSIVGSLDSGYVLNCFAYRTVLSGSKNAERSGSIAGATTGRVAPTIENCYIYHTQNSSNWAAAVGYPNKITLKNFFHNRGNAFYESTSNNAQTYNGTSFCTDDGTPIVNPLNDWIKNGRGKNNYSQFTFNEWDMPEGSNPCFK